MSPIRRWFAIPAAVLVAAAALAAAYGFVKWREGTLTGGQLPAEPFRIAGNLYYVGANDVASFLLTGPQGDVLIDGGYPGTAKMIEASITKLGFDIKDVKILLNSEPHYDHAGGLAELQKDSGAALYASAASADVLSSGGDDPAMILPFRMLAWSGITRYTAPRVDGRVADGQTVRLGPIALTAHLTPGHTRGCTSWTFQVHDGGRTLNVVSACSLVRLGGSHYPGQDADFVHTFDVLRSLPCDIWVTSHARLFGRYAKFTARATAADPANPFIDPAGYRAYIDHGEAQFRNGIEH